MTLILFKCYLLVGMQPPRTSLDNRNDRSRDSPLASYLSSHPQSICRRHPDLLEAMKNFQNIQLALYAVIVASILVWLLVALLDNAALAIGGYYDYDYDSCDQTIVHEVEAQPIHDHQTLQELIESIIMPPVGNDDGSSDHSNLIVSDILAKTPRINVFSSLTRDFDPVISRLNDNTQNTTVLAPLNSVISDLPRKPWEDPEDYERYGEVNAYKGSDGQERAKRNLLRFVQAHLVPASPWAEGEEVATVGGGKVKWIKEGDKIFVSDPQNWSLNGFQLTQSLQQIEPGHIEVDTLASQVSNGEVWVLKGVINYK